MSAKAEHGGHHAEHGSGHGADRHLLGRIGRNKAVRWGALGVIAGAATEWVGLKLGSLALTAIGALTWPVAAAITVGGAIYAAFKKK